MTVDLTHSVKTTTSESIPTNVPGGEIAKIGYNIAYIGTVTYENIYSQNLTVGVAPLTIDLSSAKYPGQDPSLARDLVTGQTITIFVLNNLGDNRVTYELLTVGDNPIPNGSDEVAAKGIVFKKTTVDSIFPDIRKITLQAAADTDVELLLASELS